jgi:hypothetical protein
MTLQTSVQLVAAAQIKVVANKNAHMDLEPGRNDWLLVFITCHKTLHC